MLHDVKLGWNANSEPDLAGYIIYAGRVSGLYTLSKDVGNVLQDFFTINADGDWFFALAAYNTALQQSTKSAEVPASFMQPPNGVGVFLGAAPRVVRGTILTPRVAVRGT